MKKVKLTVQNSTDGTDKTEIGTAEVDEIPNGAMMVNLTITDPKIIELLGGSEIKGIVPFNTAQTTWKEED